MSFQESKQEDVAETYRRYKSELEHRTEKVMSRREDRSSKGQQTTRGFENASMDARGAQLPFDRPDQQYVVFSTSHVDIPPRITDPKGAMIRVYGAFPTVEHAKDYAMEIQEKDPDINLQITAIRQWILGCSNFVKLTDQSYSIEKSRAILERYHSDLDNCKQRFDDYMQSPDEAGHRNPAGDPAAGESEEPADGEPEESEEPAAGQAYLRRFPRDLEIRGQNVCAVSALTDSVAPPGTPHEFLFCVWGCFEDVAECDAWIRAVGSTEITQFDIHIVNLYEWCTPSRLVLDQSMPSNYRVSELDRIMKQTGSMERDKEAFRQWCTENNAEVPVIEVGVDDCPKPVVASIELNDIE